MSLSIYLTLILPASCLLSWQEQTICFSYSWINLEWVIICVSEVLTTARFFFILFYFSLCKRYCFVEFHKTHSFTFPSMNHLLGSNLSWSVHYVITYNCQSQPFWFRIQGSHLASWSHFLSFFALVKITHRYCMINDSLSGFDLRSITLFFHLHT